MKANKGDKIKLIKDVYYGTAYGLIKVEKGKEFTVKARRFWGDGIVTEEEIKVEGNLGSQNYNIEIWDSEYKVIS